MLVKCWPTVCDAGPTLNQHWVDVSCLLGCLQGLWPQFLYPLIALVCRICTGTRFYSSWTYYCMWSNVYDVSGYQPAYTRRWINVGSRLVRRRRRCTSLKPALGQRLLSVGRADDGVIDLLDSHFAIFRVLIILPTPLSPVALPVSNRSGQLAEVWYHLGALRPSPKIEDKRQMRIFISLPFPLLLASLLHKTITCMICGRLVCISRFSSSVSFIGQMLVLLFPSTLRNELINSKILLFQKNIT